MEWRSPGTRALVRLVERTSGGYTILTVSKCGAPAARTTSRLALAEVFPHQRAMFFFEPGGRWSIASSRLPDEHLRAATEQFGAKSVREEAEQIEQRLNASLPPEFSTAREVVAQADRLLGSRKCPR